MQIPQGRDRAGGREKPRAAQVKTVKVINAILRSYRGVDARGLDYGINGEDGERLEELMVGDGTHANSRICGRVAEALGRALEEDNIKLEE